ncbi:MAG TPA: DUF4405 domain-containing protein [Syntrophomonadaceae bacterium]|nr:DUF4405 domain-containing protein [Syntrophomonadaceae bacterium]
MTKNRSGASRVYIRSTVAISMLVTWFLSAMTGFLLWAAPTGPRSGQMLLLLGLNKRAWGDWHFWFSVLALGLTAIHLVVNWKGFTGSIKYLVKARTDA